MGLDCVVVLWCLLVSWLEGSFVAFVRAMVGVAGSARLGTTSVTSLLRIVDAAGQSEALTYGCDTGISLQEMRFCFRVAREKGQARGGIRW